MFEDVFEGDESCCVRGVVGDERDVGSAAAHGEEDGAEVIGSLNYEQRAYGAVMQG